MSTSKLRCRRALFVCMIMRFVAANYNSTMTMTFSRGPAPHRPAPHRPAQPRPALFCLPQLVAELTTSELRPKYFQMLSQFYRVAPEGRRFS